MLIMELFTQFTMNCQGTSERLGVYNLKKGNRRFNRSQSKDSLSITKRALSSCSSEENFHKFYVRGSHIPRNQQFIQDNFQPILKEEDSGLIDFVIKRKQKTMTEKFKNEIQALQNKQKQQLSAQVQKLKIKNQELQLRFKTLSNSLSQNINKQNRSINTNKMREKTQKQRVKELQSQNSHLKQTIQALKAQLNGLRCSKITEQTENSAIDNTFQFQIQLEKNQKQIFCLNEDIRKLQIEIDFINRRNHSEINIIKINYQKQLKILKDKNQQLTKNNLDLKKKNSELKYLIKGTRDKKCQFCATKKVQKYQSLLQLSSDGE